MRLEYRRSRVSRSLLLCALAWMGLAVWPARAADPAARPTNTGVLHLANGDFVAGRLAEGDQPGRLRWQPDAFAGPFDFFRTSISAVHLPAPANPPKIPGDTCFELAGGSVLFGTLVELDPQRATLDVPPLGRLAVERENVLKMTRVGESSPVFVGPAGFAGWRMPNPKDGWRELSGQLFSDVEGASLRSDFALPPLASIEFELSWTKRPDFILALGVDDTPESLQHAFRFEVWEDELIVRCESRHEADLTSLGPLPAGAGRTIVQVLLDQDAGRLIVPSPDGKILAKITLKEKAGHHAPGVVLINQRGTLRLERLRVQRWNGEIPREIERGKAQIRRSDDTSVDGEIDRLDKETKEFVVRTANGETRVPQASFASAVLAPPHNMPPREICAVGQDGSRLYADLIKVADGALWLTVPGVSAPVRMPVSALRSLRVTPPATKATSEQAGQTGVLEVDGVRLTGHLVDGKAADGTTCLVWKPDASESASALRAGLDGRVVYKPRLSAREDTSSKKRMGAVMQGAGGMQAMVMVAPAARQPLVRAADSDRPLALHLVSGDMLPCEVTKIDEQAVWFYSPVSQGKSVPHAKVKAVELAWLETTAPRLAKNKRERLLTLPRMQKESPPTHLIQSRNGDYLRGRVIKLDDATLQVEVHLETKEIPRDRVARIIWLHAGEPEGSQPAPVDGSAPRVHAVRNDGIRLTFNAERSAGGEILGTSDLLGPCRVAVKDLDRLLFGRAIEQDAAELPYHRWQLHDAAEPQYVKADGSRPTGTESDLVGKPAPDFTLDLLDGKSFRLADRKGKVVVLDFWATWCGPCLQAMPQVERVVKEFPTADVQLVAVNLEEAPKTIQALLERQKLELTVALDRDGVVAGKYKANAIPQTVVIDREGNVARLFVGSSPHLADELREAIKGAATDEKNAKP